MQGHVVRMDSHIALCDSDISTKNVAHQRGSRWAHLGGTSPQHVDRSRGFLVAGPTFGQLEPCQPLGARGSVL